MSTQNELMWLPVFWWILQVTIVLGGLVFFVWLLVEQLLQERKCPACQKLEAAQIEWEELLGRFTRVEGRGQRNKSYLYSVRYEKYRYHYRCKYCGFEWSVIESRRA